MRGFATCVRGGPARFLSERLQALHRQAPVRVDLLGDGDETVGGFAPAEVGREVFADETLPGQRRLPAETGEGEIARLDRREIRRGLIRRRIGKCTSVCGALLP